jgi:hypothetical protein
MTDKEKVKEAVWKFNQMNFDPDVYEILYPLFEVATDFIEGRLGYVASEEARLK